MLESRNKTKMQEPMIQQVEQHLLKRSRIDVSGQATSVRSGKSSKTNQLEVAENIGDGIDSKQEQL